MTNEKNQEEKQKDIGELALEELHQKAMEVRAKLDTAKYELMQNIAKRELAKQKISELKEQNNKKTDIENNIEISN
ncbi:MAG: hypothetical protein J5881_00975 [Clostridia bacterium]|nr:hypothetical protein [Clostridia bacterium]